MTISNTQYNVASLTPLFIVVFFYH